MIGGRQEEQGHHGHEVPHPRVELRPGVLEGGEEEEEGQEVEDDEDPLGTRQDQLPQAVEPGGYEPENQQRSVGEQAEGRMEEVGGCQPSPRKPCVE